MQEEVVFDLNTEIRVGVFWEAGEDDFWPRKWKYK